MKPRTMLWIVVIFGCGLAAGYATSQVLGDSKSQAHSETRVYVRVAEPAPALPIKVQAPPETRVRVLVAKQKLAPWTPIKDPSRYFEVKEVPDYAAPKRPITSLRMVKNEILGKSLSEGAALSEDDLLGKDQADLNGSSSMRPGDRALALHVSPAGLAGGFVLPGSRVDVLATSRGQDPTTTTVVQNMLVLAVDTKVVRAPESPKECTVTLAASPEECQILTLAENTCELKLVLRPVSDAPGAPNNTSPKRK